MQELTGFSKPIEIRFHAVFGPKICSDVIYTYIITSLCSMDEENNEFANPDLQRVVESKTLMSCFLLRQQLMLGMKIAQEGAVVL